MNIKKAAVITLALVSPIAFSYTDAEVAAAELGLLEGLYETNNAYIKNRTETLTDKELAAIASSSMDLGYPDKRLGVHQLYIDINTRHCLSEGDKPSNRQILSGIEIDSCDAADAAWLKEADEYRKTLEARL